VALAMGRFRISPFLKARAKLWTVTLHGLAVASKSEGTENGEGWLSSKPPLGLAQRPHLAGHIRRTELKENHL